MNLHRAKLNKFFQSDLGDTLLHAKNFFTGDIAIKGLAFISMPVFTRLMAPDDYGIVSVYNATLGILTVLISLNMTDGISRYYFEKDKKDFGEYLSSILKGLALILFVFLIIFLIFHNKFLSWFELPTNLFTFLIVGILFYIINKLFRQIHISRKKSKEYVLVNIIFAYGSFGLSWLLLGFFDGQDYFLRILGVVVTQIAIALWMLRKSFHFVEWNPINWNHIKYSIKFGLPRLPYVLSGVILSQFDRIMIGKQAGVNDAGIYSVGYNVGGLSLIIISAIVPALLPNFYQMMNDKRYGDIDKLNKQLMWIITASGIALMILGGPILKLLADKQYYAGASIVPAVVLGYMFYALAGVYNRYCGYYKITIIQSIGALIAGIVNILLNYYLIPRYGIIAAAYTTAVSYLIMAILTWIISIIFIKGYVSSIKLFVLPTLVSVIAFVIISYVL